MVKSKQNAEMATWLASAPLIKKILIDDRWGRETTSFKMEKGMALKVNEEQRDLGMIMHNSENIRLLKIRERVVK